MADPHIQSPMDNWDYFTVIVYRLGFVVASIAIFALPYSTFALKGIFVAAVMLASSMHLYLKQYRFIFQFAVWIGLLLAIWDYSVIAIGAMFVAIGGLSYKEYFCFRIFGLNAMPVLVVILWFAMVLDLSFLLQVITLICGTLLVLLSIQKWRMPLHFDIGDKNKYQV